MGIAYLQLGPLVTFVVLAQEHQVHWDGVGNQTSGRFPGHGQHSATGLYVYLRGHLLLPLISHLITIYPLRTDVRSLAIRGTSSRTLG